MGILIGKPVGITLLSFAAVTAGFFRLKLLGRPVAGDDDIDAMDFEVSPTR